MKLPSPAQQGKGAGILTDLSLGDMKKINLTIEVPSDTNVSNLVKLVKCASELYCDQAVVTLNKLSAEERWAVQQIRERATEESTPDQRRAMQYGHRLAYLIERIF